MQSKYDRQIRLFGVETQDKLCNLKVQICGESNLAACEVLKNIVLLGIPEINASKELLQKIKQIIPDKLTDINENLKIGRIKPDFGFIINKHEELECDYYFICEKCLTIKFNDCNHDCEEREISNSMKFLCGAFAVQEFLKRIRNLEAVDNYKINL